MSRCWANTVWHGYQIQMGCVVSNCQLLTYSAQQAMFSGQEPISAKYRFIAEVSSLAFYSPGGGEQCGVWSVELRSNAGSANYRRTDAAMLVFL